MRVVVVDDINLQEVGRKNYIFWPNSVRRDVPFEFAIPHGYPTRTTPYTSKDLDDKRVRQTLGLPTDEERR